MTTTTLPKRGPLRVETPPEWMGESHLAICSPDGNELARVHVGDDEGEAKRLALLMAAAPLLTQAIEQLSVNDAETRKVLVAALAVAQGRDVPPWTQGAWDQFLSQI